jgi:hypothetical protein
MLRETKPTKAEEKKAPLTDEEKQIIEDEYRDVDSSKAEPLLEHNEVEIRITSIQLFLLYLLKKYPNLVGKLNGNVVAPIVGKIETE